MFMDMFSAFEKGEAPKETFYDGYVVNAVLDAAYRSAKASFGSRYNWRYGAAARVWAKTAI
jgi:hypothetical protein